MTERRRPLIAANWKMNGSHETGAELAREIAHRARQAVRPAAVHHPHADILICPPAILVPMVREALTGSPVWLGGQDCHWAASGAYTGDISAPMLKDAGAGWVIVGHSERRAYHAETDAEVLAKAEAALAAGLNVIVCVGETEAERDSGHTLDVVARQIDGSLPSAASPSRIVVAYEPIWAIGTGRTPTLDEIATVHAHIRALVAAKLAGGETVRVLYGGSVKPSNAGEVMALADVDGALVGGASLVATDFWAIVEAVPGRDGV